MTLDIKSQVQANFAPKKVSIEEFAESSTYCNPPEAPLWMADLSFKPIGEVAVGDKTVGWAEGDSGIRELCEAVVTDVVRRQSQIVKVTLASGRDFRCTADHLWLTASNGGTRGQWFAPPKVGRKLVHVIDPSEPVPDGLERDAAWLGGLFDGEGSVGKGAALFIAQSRSHNPEICAEIERVLARFGWAWTATPEGYYLKTSESSVRYAGVNRASRQMLTNFVNWCTPVRWTKVARKIFGAGWRTADKIISVEPDGYGEVVALTTSTGNYVANGYASKNCNKRVYPRQKLLLKLMFLEELTNREEDILNHWMKGGSNGELSLSPKLRERTQFLRDEGYEHFREIVLVGGRRCSKGFVTAIAMAKLMYDCLLMGDPNEALGIDPEKEIYFSCIAASLDQAQKYQYADFSSTVGSCAAYQKNLTKLYEREFSVATDNDLRKMEAHKRRSHRMGRDISKLRGVALAANANTVRGSATMAVAFDEMAFMEVGVETDASAEKVYDALIPSLSQFGKHAMVFCNSSPVTKLGRFFERFGAGMKVDEDGSIFDPYTCAFQFPSWALFEGWWEDEDYIRKASLAQKRCITASPDWDEEQRNEDGSYFYTEADRDLIKQGRNEEKQNPDVYKVERRGQFAEVVDAYLDPVAVERCFMGMPRGDDQYVPLQSNMSDPRTFMYDYYCHLDPSSTTAGFGFAMGHMEKLVDPNDDAEREHVVFDIIKRWNPKDFPDGVIDWETVMEQVFSWVTLFRPVEVGMDQYNSDAPIQWLSKELRNRGIGGIRVIKKTATAQTNWDRAEIFKTALYRNLVHAPFDREDCRFASLELKYLQQHNTGSKFPRVDKQDIGPVQTKDMADCMMTVVESIIGNIMQREAMQGLGLTELRMGASGGFMIGGYAPGTKAAALQDASRRGRGEQSFPGSGRPVTSKASVSRSGSWSIKGRRRGRR